MTQSNRCLCWAPLAGDAAAKTATSATRASTATAKPHLLPCFTSNLLRPRYPGARSLCRPLAASNFGRRAGLQRGGDPVVVLGQVEDNRGPAPVVERCPHLPAVVGWRLGRVKGLVHGH